MGFSYAVHHLYGDSDRTHEYRFARKMSTEYLLGAELSLCKAKAWLDDPEQDKKWEMFGAVCQLGRHPRGGGIE